MITAPYYDVNSVRQNVVSKYGTGGYQGSSYAVYHKVFTDDQLRVMTEIICELLGQYMQQFAFSVDQAIHQVTSTPEQIHKLFLDKLMERE